MGVRQDIYSSIKTALNSASLTASDLKSSSRAVTIKSVYNNNKDKRSLPVITISRVNMPTTDKVAFGTGFLSEREPRVIIDIYGQYNTHVEQLADQIDNYFKNNKFSLSGLSLIGIDEDDELSNANDNKVHHKSLFLTFKKWER